MEIYLSNDHRDNWRGELHDGTRRLEARGSVPDRVVVELLRLYHEKVVEPIRA
jgi:hypothetical protein